MERELKARACDINIKLTPTGTQYLGFDMDIRGEHLRFSPASTVGDQFGTAISALYNLFYEHDDGHNEWNRREYLTDDNNVVHTIVTSFEWDNEGYAVEIVMSRKLARDIDFENDFIDLEIKYYDRLLKRYTVKTVDLCYAVAKACTEVLKEYGFYGYRYSTEYDYFKMHQLLYIKSFALMNFEAREPINDSEYMTVKCTSFEKEIELLMFDM